MAIRSTRTLPRGVLSLALLLVLGSQVSTHAGGSSSRPNAGTTTINGISSATQNLSAVDETNILLDIVSAGNTHTFTMGWNGTLVKLRQHPTTVYTDQSNIYSAGPQDFSGVSLILPTGGATGNITGNAAGTATALAANPANCSVGEAPLGVSATGAVEGCADIGTQAELDLKQPLDADLTTLAGKTVVGTGTDVRLSTGAFTADHCVRVDVNGNFATAGAPCGAGGSSGVTSFNTRIGAVLSISGDYTATQVTNTPAGAIAATNLQTAVNELDTEKQPLDTDLTTLAGKTVAGTGTDVRLSTGAFTADDCVRVDASGNFATAGAPCGEGGSGGVTSVFGRTGSIAATAGDYTGALITNTPAGSISAVTVQTAIDELDTEKQPLDTELTTLAGKTVAGTGTDVRLSTGAFTADDCVRVDASGNFATAGAPCGEGGSGGVTSVFGRTGSIAATAGDYTGALITNTPAGSISAVTVQTAINELDTEKQPLDTELTTLAGKTVAGTGTEVRLSTGAFTADDCVRVDVNGNFTTAGAPCGASGGSITSVFGRTGAVVGTAGDYTGALITNTPAGSISAVTMQTAINELDTEKQPLDADLTTLAGKTLVGTGADLRFSTGSFTTNDCVKIDASGNLVTAGVPCSGAGGLQANADIQRQITNAVDVPSAVCMGGTTQKNCWYGNDTDGPVWFVVPAQDMNWKLSDNFKLNIKDNSGALITDFDEATKTVTVANTLVVTGSLVAPNVVRLFESASAPTVNDDTTAGFAPHSEWIETGSDPDKVWTCVDATTGAAVWQLGGGGGVTQVDKSLNDAFDVGKGIDGANSQANAFFVGDGTGKKDFWYDVADGWHEKVTPAGNEVHDIASTFAYVLSYNGTEFLRWDSTGNQLFSGIGKPTIPIPWSAAGVETDGTNCATQSQSTVNTGVRVQDFGCVAFATAAGTFYQIFEMRGAWSHTDTMTFTLRVRTIGTTTKTWKADVALWCLSDGDAYPSDTNFDSATPQEISMTTGATANVRKSATTAAITAGGTCAANDSVVARVKTKSGHDATAAEAKVIGGFLAPKYLKLGD